ncbi:MAG: murein L,D-transpeptidase catalytic domain family protein [Gammaproteobacteria bacterium]
MLNTVIYATSLVLSSLITNVALANETQTPAINEQAIISHASNLNPQALNSAVHAYQWAVHNGYVKNPNVLTVIDFTLPSNKKRAWLIDLKSSKVLMNFYTTHGKNSGLDYAQSFSNTPSSDKTSLGVYTTLNAYYGKHGLSERLMGLEKGVNNNALARAVVVHPAAYASPSYIKSTGRAGRSWGCFGISPDQSSEFVNYTKNGSVIYAYASQEKHDPILSADV